MAITTTKARPALTLVHVLAAEPHQAGSIKTRATIRAGHVESGDRLGFEQGSGHRPALTVLSVVHTPRWATIVFAGRAEDLALVRTGTYLHARPGGATTASPVVSQER